MKTSSQQHPAPGAAQPVGLFGALHRESTSQKPAWPFCVKSSKPAARSTAQREGPGFKS